MRLLVIGRGFIATNFIYQTLRKHPATEIINVSKSAHPEISGTTYIQGDMTDYNLMQSLMSKVDTVINLAGDSHVDKSISNPIDFFRSNTEGMIILLEALRHQPEKKHLIQVSSDEVYGPIAEGSFTEESRTRPVNPYSAVKAAAESLCQAYRQTYGIDIVITRCANNYGSYQSEDKLIPKTIIRALKGEKIPVYGKGESVREWLHVSDHCRALETIRGMGGGDVYNISSGEEFTNLQVVKKILKLLGKSEDLIGFVKDRPGNEFRYSIDSSKLRGLQWEPQIKFDEGLKDTVGWYSKKFERHLLEPWS